jgi:hypothetical protein
MSPCWKGPGGFDRCAHFNILRRHGCADTERLVPVHTPYRRWVLGLLSYPPTSPTFSGRMVSAPIRFRIRRSISLPRDRNWRRRDPYIPMYVSVVNRSLWSRLGTEATRSNRRNTFESVLRVRTDPTRLNWYYAFEPMQHVRSGTTRSNRYCAFGIDATRSNWYYALESMSTRSNRCNELTAPYRAAPTGSGIQLVFTCTLRSIPGAWSEILILFTT